MARRTVEVETLKGSTFYATASDAIRIAKTNPHKWDGNKRLILESDRNQRVSWTVKQSGYAGPLVMQIAT